MFMDRNAQYCPDVRSSQLAVQIQGTPNQNSSKLFFGIIKVILKFIWGSKKTENSQHNIEGEQSGRTDIA